MNLGHQARVMYFYPPSPLVSPAAHYGRRLQGILALAPPMKTRLECSQPSASQEERPLQLHAAAAFVLQLLSLLVSDSHHSSYRSSMYPEAPQKCRAKLSIGTWCRSPGRGDAKMEQIQEGKVRAKSPRGEVKGTILVSQAAFRRQRDPT